jgi:serine/threonine protein kinase
MTPEQFGRYRLVEKIGRGATGTVFIGEYGSLRRPFAIKLLHEHLIADGSAERMLAEARALSMLDHPGIVNVVDCGMTDDGRAFVVMEYLAGELLHQRLRRGPLHEDRVVLFSRQLASALEVAHAAGIIHRDVKPENAFIVPDPDVLGGERVKLIDFGIAKCGDEEQTDTGVVLGTPAYMAPEQFAGSRRIDHRADIYALGIVMYRMATGTLPFIGDTEELRAEHEYVLPAPASLAGVSPGLSAIIDRCLAKDPAARFASMAQLAAALSDLDLRVATQPLMLEDLADEVDDVLAQPSERAVTVPPPDLRTRLPWHVVAGVVAALAFVLFYVQLDPRPRETSAPRERIVESEEALPVAPPAVTPITVPATTKPPAAKAEQPRRESPRVRPRPVRREPVRTEAVAAPAPEPPARKKEDYASVTPPTLY